MLGISLTIVGRQDYGRSDTQSVPGQLQGAITFDQSQPGPSTEAWFMIGNDQVEQGFSRFFSIGLRALTSPFVNPGGFRFGLEGEPAT
ncbi:MAG: hypothetical protein GY888_27155 [Planctomycetaceae bacterium]|nr:hypothetical protein [Planctomycetaceae bacterium]